MEQHQQRIARHGSSSCQKVLFLEASHQAAPVPPPALGAVPGRDKQPPTAARSNSSLPPAFPKPTEAKMVGVVDHEDGHSDDDGESSLLRKFNESLIVECEAAQNHQQQQLGGSNDYQQSLGGSCSQPSTPLMMPIQPPHFQEGGTMDAIGAVSPIVPSGQHHRLPSSCSSSVPSTPMSSTPFSQSSPSAAEPPVVHAKLSANVSQSESRQASIFRRNVEAQQKKINAIQQRMEEYIVMESLGDVALKERRLLLDATMGTVSTAGMQAEGRGLLKYSDALESVQEALGLATRVVECLTTLSTNIESKNINDPSVITANELLSSAMFLLNHLHDDAARINNKLGPLKSHRYEGGGSDELRIRATSSRSTSSALYTKAEQNGGGSRSFHEPTAPRVFVAPATPQNMSRSTSSRTVETTSDHSLSCHHHQLQQQQGMTGPDTRFSASGRPNNSSSLQLAPQSPLTALSTTTANTRGGPINLSKKHLPTTGTPPPQEMRHQPHSVVVCCAACGKEPLLVDGMESLGNMRFCPWCGSPASAVAFRSAYDSFMQQQQQQQEFAAATPTNNSFSFNASFRH